MKRMRFWGIVLTVFLSLSVLCGNASSLVLYDDFSGTYIDRGKWREGELTREIDPVGHKLIYKNATPNPVTITSYPYTNVNSLSFSNPASINSIQADVAIVESAVVNSGQTRAWIAGRWYNDGTPGGGMTGDVWAEVALLKSQTGYFAWYGISKLTNADGSASVNITNYAHFATTITSGTTYTLFVGYDSVANQFTFQIGSEVVTVNPTNTPALPAWAGDALMPWKGLSTRVQANNANSSSYISATFDNVYKNGALYDDFSSSTIDSTKWTAYEFVREISNGKLRSKIRSSSASTGGINNTLSPRFPRSINTIQAKATLLDYQNPHGLLALADISGAFYNDGTAGGGQIGDVVGHVYIGWVGGAGVGPVAGYDVYKYTTTDGSAYDVLASGTFSTPVTPGPGNAYTLFLKWDGSKITLRFESEEVNYTPPLGTSINSVHSSQRRVRTYVLPQATNKEATIEALFDDVMVEYEGIVGQVFRDADGTGIRNTLIEIYDSNWDSWDEVSTDPYGYYAYGGLPAGSYYLTTSNAPGFIDEVYDNIPLTFNPWPPVGATPVILVQGGGAIVNFGLSPGGSISGQVIKDSDSTGIAGIEIDVLDANWNFWVKWVNTDSSGNYTVGGLTTGNYYVYTWSNIMNYVDEYYNNIPVIGNPFPPVGAAPVSVTVGGNTAGINFGLAVGGSISGQVTDDSTHAPIPNVGITVYDSNWTVNWAYQRWAYTDSSGNYTFTGLPTGNYFVGTSNHLGYIDEYYNNVTNPNDAVLVSVTQGSNTPNVNFGLVLGQEIYVAQHGCADKTPCYSSIQNAIDSPDTVKIIFVTQETYDENVILNSPKLVILQGGWDLTFTNCLSWTAINDSLTISDGTLIVGKIILQ
jgi:hypothetical protein